MGPFPMAIKQLQFLVVYIYYFTKWVEAEALATITEKNIRSFVWRNIICRYGIPRVLVSDNGKQFDNSAFRDFCSELGIKNHYSSPTHPQANGQVEVTNRSLLKIIKTRLERAKGIWPDKLPSVLWAYRITVRTPTRETLFRLAYGTDAVIPAEIGLTSYQVDSYSEDTNEEGLRLQLDLVDEVRTVAEQRLAPYQNLMAKHYNSNVRHRDFQVGDLVLRKVMGAARDPSQGKLRPNWEGLYKITSWQRKGTYHLETLDGRRLQHSWNTEHLRKYYQQREGRQLPLISQLFNFIAISFLLFQINFVTIIFSTLFKPEGVGTFLHTCFKFLWKNIQTQLCFITTAFQLLNPHSGRTPRGINIHVYKVDGPHEG